MAFITLTCPACGAALNNVDSERDFYFCNFCGNKVMLDKTIIEHRGSVSVQGIVSEKSLLQRASILLSDSNFEDAAAYYDRVLDINPTCAAAYMGKLCCQYSCKSPDDLQGLVYADYSLEKNYQHALEYSSGSERTHYEWINGPEHMLGWDLYQIDLKCESKTDKLKADFSQKAKPYKDKLIAEQKNVSSHNPLYKQALYEYNKANLRVNAKSKSYGILFLVSAVLALISFVVLILRPGHDSETISALSTIIFSFALFFSILFGVLYLSSKGEINIYIRKLRPLENFVVTHQNSVNYLRQKTSELANEQQIAENKLLYQSYLEKQAVVDDYRARYPELQFKDIEKPRQSS